MNPLQQEISNRRTFAIISHPDAGKTTLTEKLLLYSGMVRTAGMVRARKGGKSTSSDWMAMEQERGISITASAMQFRYKGAVINVLDTPGHQDFSEDTYRTLTAADSAIMVIDAAKGVEAQTRKLFQVCRLRGIPIITFINKMDLPSRETLDLMHELEQVLGIQASPLNWPVGYGKHFVGVADVRSKELLLFTKSAVGGADRAGIERIPLSEVSGNPRVEAEVLTQLTSELELLEAAGNPYSKEAFLGGQITPVFFGSALTNFGVEPFFDTFVEIGPAPRGTRAVSTSGEELLIEPDREDFSAFVFKIQSNMDARHRDSMAFLRVASGIFERDMSVLHHRSGKQIRLSRSYSMVARDRNTVESAYPGDVVGVINPGVFAIGDTVSTRAGFDFKPMPRFAPEVVAQLRPKDVMKHKAFDKGIEQLSLEGTVQVLRSYDNPHASPYVAAVGKLQFDVLQYRLQDEYGVETLLEQLPYQYSAYLIGDTRSFKRTQSSALVKDKDDKVLLLYKSEWEKNYMLEQNKQHALEEFVRE
jgi:peptide chain release factor 3